MLNWPVSIEHSWSFDRFAQIWGDTVSHLFKVCKRSEADNLDSLAYLWIGLGAAQEFGEPPSEWCQTLTPDPRAWEELATKIAKKNDARKEWIVQLACMLAPENGLRDEPVGHLLGHQGLSTILTRPDVAAEVRAQRLEALEAFAEGEMKEFGMRLIAPNAFIQNLESGTLMRWARLLDWDVQIHVDQSDEEQVLTKDTAVGLSEQARKYLSFGNRVIKAYKEGRLSAEREKLMAEVKAFLPALSRAISSEEVSEDTTDELDLTTSGLLAFVVVAAKPHPLNLLGNGSLCPSWEQVETVEQERDWDRLLSDLEAL